MTGKPFAQHGTFREMSDILVTTILRDSCCVLLDGPSERNRTTEGKIALEEHFH